MISNDKFFVSLGCTNVVLIPNYIGDPNNKLLDIYKAADLNAVY